MLQSPRAASASHEKAARVRGEGGMLKKKIKIGGAIQALLRPPDVESVPDVQSGEAELRCSEAASGESNTAQRTYLSLK